MASQTIFFPPIEAFPFQITYTEIDRYSPRNTFHSHTHPQCELYINVSGDVSFMVEDRIYPVSRGNIILARPNEYHHCIYHSDALHKHFWILFSSDQNAQLLSSVLDRHASGQNLFTLPPEQTEVLLHLCHQMAQQPQSQIAQYSRFFQLMQLLEDAHSADIGPSNCPKALVNALDYIAAHFHEPLSIAQLARQAYVSINTLERLFAAELNMSPSAYLRKKRLAFAARLLLQGCSVTAACEESGFSDCAYFISVFRKAYGMTPLQYKKASGL